MKKLLRKKLALMLANLRKKRPYYCEVEYLQSSGTQYIDTGVVFSNSNHTYKWDIGAQAVNTSNTNYNWFCGLFENGANSPGTYSDSSTNYNFYGVGTYYQNGQVITSPLNNGDKYGIIRNVFTITNFAGTLPIILFGRNQSNGIKCEATKKIFYYQIYDNDTLVRDLIPVLDWDFVPCMYDRITGQFFYNAGTGTFSYGREIHYVDYIESTGTQYIDTGLLSTANSTVDIVFGFTSMASGSGENCAIFGGRNNTTGNTFTLFKLASGNPQYFRFDYNGQKTIGTANNLTWNTTSKYRFTYNGSIGKIENITTGESVSESFVAGSSFTTNPITLFAVNTNGAIGQLMKGCIYHHKYSDGINSVDLYPAIDENGIGFMFDRVSHTIYDNAGTGKFKYPARELEFIQGTGTQYCATDFKPTDDYGYRIKQTYTTGAGEQCAIGCMESGNRFVGIYTNGNANNIACGWGSFVAALSNYTWTTGTILDVKCNYKNDRKITINDTEVKDLTDTHISGTISNSIYLMARNFGTNITKMQGKLYLAEITNGQNVVANFISCFKDGAAGMWDKENSVFYPNAGTGSFVAGKIVEPLYE